MKLEKNKHKVASIERFVWRQLKYTLVSVSILAVSLVIGVVGYHHFAEIPWIDSLLNACMILTGMGPIDEMCSVNAKLFASFYSLYSGVAFLSVSAVMIAPLAHRILHLFHAE